MSVKVPSVVLPSGARMPMLGLGVYKAAAGEEAYESVLSALRLGYRHIDTARLYENEADVGRAVRDSGIPREQIFITSKLREFHWGYDKALEGARSSNDLIGCSYIDLFLLHQPFDPKLRADTWRALEDLQKEGVLRDIGVSNFGEAHLAKLAETWKVKPAVNQIELHPWLTRQSLVNYCEENGIHVQAFSPLARVKKIDDSRLIELAKEVQATPAQVLIAWDLAKGYTTLPKSVHEARQKENLEAANVKLTPEQVTRLDAFNEDFYSGTDHVSNSAV
ncbi:Aldo/keto reductase family [Phytophthora infestans]|uniref:Aldo/keto reductase family n=1 Tax=Phytophthora infestans TaxID=4787 RepID=A0A8S9V228_PHYIN|nr:Aldo/keto reductase family [Phytophthora infestans]